MRVELGLAWAPMRHRPAPWLMLALGLAIAAALPVLAAGLRAESSLAAVTQAVADLPPAQRTVLALTTKDLRGADLQQVDATIADGLTTAGLGPAEQVLSFRPLATEGAEFGLGAVNRLDGAVRLDSGRWPQQCLPTECEVVLAAGPGDEAGRQTLTRALASLGVTATGTVTVTDQRLTGSGLMTTSRPLLLSSDPDALAGLSSLSLFGRTRAWLTTLDGSAVNRAGAAAFTAELSRITEQVNPSAPFTLLWPDAAVTAAAERASEAADRFTVLGAGAGVLQLGFALVAAAGIRRRQQLTARLLARRGASATQITAVMALQPLIAVTSGLALGTVAAGVVVALRARALSTEPSDAAWSAIGSAWPILLALGLGAVLLTVTICRWPAEAATFTRLSFDVALIAVAAGAVWLLSVSSASAGSPLAASVIVWLNVLTGMVAARFWRPLAGFAARLAGHRGPVWHLAIVAGRRRPLLPMVTAGFLAAACSSVVFAGGYQQSLQQSAADQAAAQVPLDIRVAPSTQVAAPLAVLDAPALTAAGPGIALHPVVVSPVTAFAGSTSAIGLPLVGIDTAVLPQMHEFAATTGAAETSTTLAAALAVPSTVEQRGPVIPAGARRVDLQVSGVSDAFTVNLWLATAQGQEWSYQLSGSGSDLGADLTPGPERTVRAIELVESASHLTYRTHGVGEGDTDRPLANGDLTLGALSVDGAPLPTSWSGWGSEQATLGDTSAASRTVRFQIGDQRVVLTPGFVPRAAMAPVPVAVDPATAARAGARRQFGLTVNGETVPVRIVAVIPRLPTIGRSFVLADRAVATALLNRSAPGTAAVSQVWISAPETDLATVRAALESSPAATATITYRSDLTRAIAGDPVATRSIWLLRVAGAIAVLLAMVAAATQVRAELEESAADHFALELDGFDPSRLRSVLLLRSVSILAVGIPLGIIGGIAITKTAVRLVVAGPGGTAITPPLRVVISAGGTAIPMAAALLGCLAACALAAVTGFRESRLRQPELDLR